MVIVPDVGNLELQRAEMVMDEKGYVRLTGRLKEVIVSSGNEIYPAEVEEVLYMLPDVLEAQVFGFPHPDKGQEVAAWIRLKQGSRLSALSIAAHARDYLGEEKVPAHIKFVKEFPMTRSGKVQKFKMSETAEKEYLKS